MTTIAPYIDAAIQVGKVYYLFIPYLVVYSKKTEVQLIHYTSSSKSKRLNKSRVGINGLGQLGLCQVG